MGLAGLQHVDKSQIESDRFERKNARIVENLTDDKYSAAWIQRCAHILYCLPCVSCRENLEKSPQDGGIIGTGQRAAQHVRRKDLNALCRTFLFDNLFGDRHNLGQVDRGCLYLWTRFSDR